MKLLLQLSLNGTFLEKSRYEYIALYLALWLDYSWLCDIFLVYKNLIS